DKEEFSNDEEEMTQVKVLMALADDQLLVGKNDACNGEWIDINIRKKEVKESLFIPASLDYDHEMVPKSKDWVKRHNPNSKLPNFNTGRIIVLESQAVNECLNPIEAFNDPESTKDSESESLTPLALLRTLYGAYPSSEVLSLTYQDHFLRERPSLGIMKHTKPKTQESLSKSVLGHVIVSDIKLINSSVPIEVKNIEQHSQINELTKLV
nr:hypothetical protein [Tanacetum cinerariifolium]